jgi:hypothetical protein
LPTRSSQIRADRGKDVEALPVYHPVRRTALFHLDNPRTAPKKTPSTDYKTQE